MLPIVGVLIPFIEDTIHPQIQKTLYQANNFDLNKDNSDEFVNRFRIQLLKLFQAKFRQSLSEYPIMLVGEEKQTSAKICYIDIIDQVNFLIHKLPHCSISLTFKENDQTIANMIIDLNNINLYYSYIGKGAFVNKQRMRIKNHLNRNLLVHIDKNTEYLSWLTQDSFCSFLPLNLAVAYLCSNFFDGIILNLKNQKNSYQGALHMAIQSGSLFYNLQGKELKIDEIQEKENIILTHPNNIQEISNFIKKQQNKQKTLV